MEVFLDGRVYVSRGESLPFMCPNCGLIIEWREIENLLTCEKCDFKGTEDEFSDVRWRISRPN